jgi:hypothetical protein
MLTAEIQAEFIADAPDVFLPVAGGGAEWVPHTSGWRRLIATC